jgi:hypothetical protein
LKELEEKCLAARSEIVRGKLELQSAAIRKGQPVQITTYSIVFDSDRYRLRRKIFPAGGDGADQGVPAFDETFVLTQSDYIVHSNDVDSAGRTMAVTWKHRRELGENSNSVLDVFDPRLIGIIPAPSSTLMNYQYDENSLFIEAAIGEPTISREEIDRVKTWRIVQHTKHGVKISRWIAPNRGYSILRIQVEPPPIKDTVVVDTMDCEVVEYQIDDTSLEPATVWFPKNVVYQRMLDGNVGIKETLTVLSAHFNGPISQEEFTLSKMGVQAGTSVLEHPAHPEYSRMWDGEKIVPVSAIVEPVDPLKEPETSRLWILLSVNSGILAVFLFFLYLYRQKRGQGKRV